ncbi:dihydroxyacetone kinase subunit DhaL [Roseobacter weihaiensis]|uniref:dihydroxyacetone kinase subunit DhaL n=1 Tax=Roseobacter weihaiensis TaxID=2763262 RepID=UPI001D09BFE4|nr:dihydroxyacetone kinase subunit DhaL [Roseobacter sp. H9]
MTQSVLTADTLRDWIRKAADVLSENRAYLTDLDSPIGDADHGNNMQRGFNAASAALPPGEDPAAVAKAVAMALISKVGGAAGPLYGTYFLALAKRFEGAAPLDIDALASALEEAVAAVKKRGKAETGMKTMIDALDPAAVACRMEATQGGTVSLAVQAAAKAAEAGASATVPMLAQRGRASYLGDRSKGHQDPGATSSAMILRALADVVAGR